VVRGKGIPLDERRIDVGASALRGRVRRARSTMPPRSSATPALALPGAALYVMHNSSCPDQVPAYIVTSVGVMMANVFLVSCPVEGDFQTRPTLTAFGKNIPPQLSPPLVFRAFRCSLLLPSERCPAISSLACGCLDL
jgi:hypothetical protein